MLRSRLTALFAIVPVLFASTLLRAQQAVASRIVAPINESRLTTLAGGVTSRARAEFDRGQEPASTQMTFVRLVLSRSPQQEAALEKFMAEQLNPSSPNYHKWLTPEQFGKLYGPSDEDITTLVTWLQSHGFTVYPVAPGGISIAFSGSVSQIESALHTQIHSFNDHGEQFLSNISNPKIPSALAPVIAGIAQLNTIKPRPYNVRNAMGTFDSRKRHFVRAGENSSGPKPLLTTGSGTTADPYSLYVVAGDAATIYDSPNSFNASFSSGTSYTGSGVTIGIGGDALILGTTVANYRTLFLGNSTQPTITNVASDPATCTNATSTTCDQDEAYLDTQISGALAPGATIHFYTSANLSLAIEQAITDNTVDIFSLSFGECEANLTTADNQLINGWWQQFNTQGVAVTVSTGDSGSAACDDDNTEETAQYGLQVSGYASTPYNVAVGGTDYVGLLSGFTTYVSTSNSASTFYRTALSYIPESTWNDSTTSNTTISANVPYADPTTGATNIVGGNGGASSCSINTNTATTLTNCTSGYPKPTWQRGSGVPSDSVRDLPDVSLLAGNGFYGAAWLVCTDDTGTVNGATVTADCATQADSNFYFFGFGGTSTSAPAFAGILALVQQKAGSRLGQAAMNLYDLYNGSNAASVFHDITVGNNSVPCTASTPDCSKNTAGNDFLTGYNTGTGYDLATGLGSVDVTQLVTHWSSAVGTAPATVSVTLSSSAITTSQTLTVTGSVTGSSGTPTGTVTLTSGTYTSSAVTLSSGSYSITVPAGSLKAGTDTITVNYSGDSTYAAASAKASITVTALTPSVTVTPASASVVSNQSLVVTIAVAGSGPTPTGTVTLKAGSYTSSATSLSSGSASITIPASTFTTAGAQTISVSYSGDAIYASATGSASVTVTIYVPLTPTVTVTPASTSINTGQSLAVTIAVTGTGATPTGTVTLASGSYTSSATSLSSGSASITIPANTLAAGTATLTASYSGDNVYAAATGTASVAVTTSAFSISGTTPSSVNAGGSSSSTITVSSASNYSGSIAVTCALTSSPTGAVKTPTCSVSGSPITVSSGTPSGPATVNFSTTGSSAVSGRITSAGIIKTGAATLLAFLVFFGIPARRRAWRAILGALVLIAALGALSACGGNSGSSGTTSGSYTFTITGTGTPSFSPTPTTTVTFTVN